MEEPGESLDSPEPQNFPDWSLVPTWDPRGTAKLGQEALGRGGAGLAVAQGLLRRSASTTKHQPRQC